MPSFPTYAFTRDNVKARFLEPRGSEAINTRHYGLPRGVYVGYIPEVTTGSLVLRLTPDARLGFSMLKVGAQSTRVQVDVFTSSDVLLDFTNHTVFPVFVIARAEYKSEFPTQGRILTRTSGPSGPQEIGICVIDKIGADLAISTTVPDQRQPPLAFSGQAFGYMYGGAIDDITFAQSATAEVIQARDDLKNPGPPPPDQRLKDRLAIDLAGDFLADQLALRTVVVVGNSRLVPATGSSMNVSGSFSEVTRQFAPFLTIGDGGTESVEGAITAPTDTDRNICPLIDDTTGLRIVDSLNGAVYGRLVYSSAVLTGTLSFTNANVNVNGIGTLFLTELQVGDIVLGGDGKYYEVASIPTNVSLTLTTAYQGASVGGVVSTRRRFTVNFFSRTSGSEVAFALAQLTNVRFFFTGWFRLDRSIFDASLFMKRDGEKPVEPLATDTVKGRVRLATAGGLAGAIFQVTNSQSPTGANNYSTLNFTAVNASVVNAGAGVANISVPGNPGPPGPGSVPGPTGPTGAPGAGANAFNSWEPSAILGPGGSHTHNVTFASATPPLVGTLVHVVGGFAFSEPFGGFSMRISSISKAGNIGTIGLDLTGLLGITRGKVFLGACI